MKKKLVAILVCVAMLAVAAVSGTLAYFTDDDQKSNVFTVGNVDITLTEPKWDEVGSKEAEDVYPGEPLAKDPTVTNVGKNPCSVRIKVENLEQFVAKYGQNAMIKFRTAYQDGKLGENWVEYEGYFYYTKVLQPGESTTALFDQIVIPFELTNNETTLNIVVSAFAAQAQGAKPSFSAVQQMTVEEIAAWMNTCFGA